MLARAAPRLSMLPRRPAWHAACRASRSFSLAAQHRSPTSYLHDLVGDANQPGLLGGYGVKAVALVDVNAGEVRLSLRLSPSLSLRLSISISISLRLRLRLTLTRSSFARRASSCPRLRCTPSRPAWRATARSTARVATPPTASRPTQPYSSPRSRRSPSPSLRCARSQRWARTCYPLPTTHYPQSHHPLPTAH